MTKTSWEYVSASLLIIAALSSGAIIWMLFWMTEQIEQVEHEKSYALVEQEIQSVASTLHAGVEDNAYWTLAYDLVTDRDLEGVFSNIGSSATDSDLFDQIFILSKDGSLLYAFDGNLKLQAHALYEPEEFAPLLAQLAESGAGQAGGVSALAPTILGVSAVTAAFIVPDDFEDRDIESYPVLLATKQLDKDALQEALAQHGIQDIALHQDGSPPPVAQGEDRLVIRNMTGTPIAALTWRIQSAGLALRADLLPLVALTSLVVFAGCLGAAFSFRAQQQRLVQATQIACTDQLTGLMNRAGLAQAMQTPAAQNYIKNGHFAAIYVDLNGFKQLNDTLGHLAGDIALRVTAERLQSSVRDKDHVVRLGGDEFLCIIFDPDPEATAVSIASKFHQQTETPIVINGKNHVVAAAVGVASATSGSQWETVMSHSDAAMYWAKDAAADHPVVYCKSMYDSTYDGAPTQLSA